MSTCIKSFQREEYEARAKVMKALAHPVRLWIVEQLESGERCVCLFVEETELDFSTISRHLKVLKESGIILDEKRGKEVYYRLAITWACDFLESAEKVCSQ